MVLIVATVAQGRKYILLIILTPDVCRVWDSKREAG